MLLSTVLNSEPAPTPSPADLIGAEVGGRYAVTEKLDAGGFGEVYKALDKKVMSRPVVIKVLKDDTPPGGDEKREWLLTKFRQEIEALSKIQDPCVVGIFDADTLPDGRPYLVMEFVRGTNLRHLLRQAAGGPGVQLQDAAEIAKQAGRALATAHAEDIIHRDLKPENIMLRRSAGGNLQVKVIDFGIAKVRNSLVASSTATGGFVAGTWQYMAPEQLLRKKVSAASDIYALGVIAYEMLTGRHPFAAKDPAQIRVLQEDGVKIKPRDLNPEVPEAAEAVIIKALSYFPAGRHQSAQEFGDKLARALTSEEELLPRPAAAAPPGARKGLLLAAVALMLTVLVGFIAWRASGDPTAPAPALQATTMPAAVPERTLTYWLTVRRKHDRAPFPSIGEKIFDAGSEFWLNVQATQPGALYLFSEGSDEGGATEWNTMFPTPGNNGDAWLQADPAGRPLRTEGYVFAGRRGTVKVWVIWARQRVELLDDVANRSFATRGVVREPDELRSFVERHSSPRPDVTLDKERFRVTLKGGDTLVDVRDLEYQP
ncbi:MAG: serine/threonine-protein kinase [Pyrinomonadaceae bacterium]